MSIEELPEAPSWATDMTNKALFECVQTDIQLLKDGDWVPDDDSCDSLSEVVAEIKRRFDNLKNEVGRK